MDQQIEKILAQFETDYSKALVDGDFDSLYLKYFSKTRGEITKMMKALPGLSPDEKRIVGPALNSLQNELKTRIETGRKDYSQKQLNDPALDLTYPVTGKSTGMLHPTTQLVREMNDFFRYYGYSVVEGPEIETAEFNFRKLNLPEGHPATDLQDTLFIKEPDLLLRTHTSSVEARVLSGSKPPIRAVAPGKTFRNETANASSMSFFHQYQGFVVDKGITIQHLKGTLDLLHKFLFGEDTILRFRYKYYPEVSPGMGTDMQCKFCHGKGCVVCKYRGWIEVLGSGMIHYNTLKTCGVDPEIYTGFAFGIGLDRLAMNKFGINDIRKLYGAEMVYL
jgi:phenylalanyl-tRNA synthetase alpha chain